MIVMNLWSIFQILKNFNFSKFLRICAQKIFPYHSDFRTILILKHYNYLSMLEFIQLVGGYMSRGSIWVFREEVGVTRMSTLSMRDRHLHLNFTPSTVFSVYCSFRNRTWKQFTLQRYHHYVSCQSGLLFWLLNTVVWRLDFPFSSSKFVKISFYLNFRGCHLLLLIKGLLWNMSVTRKPLWKPSHT